MSIDKAWKMERHTRWRWKPVHGPCALRLVPCGPLHSARPGDLNLQQWAAGTCAQLRQVNSVSTLTSAHRRCTESLGEPAKKKYVTPTPVLGTETFLLLVACERSR